MATTITEEVKAVFTADTSGLVNGIDRAKKKQAELKRAYGEKVGNVKGTILDPSSLIDKGLNALTKSMKFSAVTVGALSAGFAIGAEILSNWKAQAAAAKEQADALNESVRRLTNANTFTTSAEGAGSLAGRLTALREQQEVLRQRERELNPVSGYDKAELYAQYVANYGIPTAQSHLDSDRSTNATQQQLVGKQMGKITGEITESLQRQADLSGERLASDRQSVEISELELQRERELNDLKSAGVGTPQNLQLVNDRYDREVQSQREIRDVMESRYQTELSLANLQTGNLSTQQQGIAAARIRLSQIQSEYQARHDMTTEERRALTLEETSNRNTILSAQRDAVMKTGGQFNSEDLARRKRQIRLNRADRRLEQNDGLINASRDANGNIISGTDRVTGERRGPSSDYRSRNRGGLQSGGLGPSFVNPSFTNTLIGIPNVSAGGIRAFENNKQRGSNDQSAGHTLISAAKAQVAATNISNAYLKQMQVDISNLVTSWA